VFPNREHERDRNDDNPENVQIISGGRHTNMISTALTLSKENHHPSMITIGNGGARNCAIHNTGFKGRSSAHRG